MLAACGRVRLGSAMCTVTDLSFRPVTQAELADSEPVDGVRLEFLSPAYFSQNGAHVTAADPRLIVGSWRRHWNAWLNADRELAVDRELWRDIHLALHVTGSGLRTETHHTGYRQQSGLVTLTHLDIGRSRTGPGAWSRPSRGLVLGSYRVCPRAGFGALMEIATGMAVAARMTVPQIIATVKPWMVAAVARAAALPRPATWAAA